MGKVYQPIARNLIDEETLPCQLPPPKGGGLLALIMNTETLFRDMERLHISSSFILNRVYRTALEYEKKNLVKGTHYCFMILADKNGVDEKYHRYIER